MILHINILYIISKRNNYNYTKLNVLRNFYIVLQYLFIFLNSNSENLQILNPPLHNFDGVLEDQNEYCFTMPMENGRIVDLNLPQTVIII